MSNTVPLHNRLIWRSATLPLDFIQKINFFMALMSVPYGPVWKAHQFQPAPSQSPSPLNLNSSAVLPLWASTVCVPIEHVLEFTQPVPLMAFSPSHTTTRSAGACADGREEAVGSSWPGGFKSAPLATLAAANAII